MGEGVRPTSILLVYIHTAHHSTENQRILARYVVEKVAREGFFRTYPGSYSFSEMFALLLRKAVLPEFIAFRLQSLRLPGSEVYSN